MSTSSVRCAWMMSSSSIVLPAFRLPLSTPMAPSSQSLSHSSVVHKGFDWLKADEARPRANVVQAPAHT